MKEENHKYWPLGSESSLPEAFGNIYLWLL